MDIAVYPGMDKAAREDRIKKAFINREIPRMARLWREIGNLLAENGHDISGRLFIEEQADKKAGTRYRVIRLRWANEIAAGWTAPTLIIDATLNMALIRPYFLRAQLRAEIEAHALHQTVVQFPNRAFGKGQLAKNNKLIEQLWTWCMAYAVRRGGDWLIVTQKDVETYIKEQLNIPEFIGLAHHNAIAGQDKWRNVDGLIVIGRVPSSTPRHHRLRVPAPWRSRPACAGLQ